LVTHSELILGLRGQLLVSRLTGHVVLGRLLVRFAH
jgi:hypothetical protein